LWHKSASVELYGVVDLTEIDAGTGSDDAFVDFAARATGPLLRALVGAYGPEVGREAALDALAWGWEHWDRLSAMRNPIGYLFRVGQSAARRSARRTRRVELRASVDPRPAHQDQVRDLELERAVSHLSPRQRAAVVTVVGHGTSLREAADLLGCSVSSLRNHVERGLRHLREQLGAPNAD
jgi:RNA polymerase sigma factor (sigma-70 family)